MLNGLKCDFERYRDFHGYAKDVSILKKLILLFKYPIFLTVIIYRFGNLIDYYNEKNHRNLFILALTALCLLCNHLMVILFKVQIHENSIIGPGLFLSPKGNIIIGAKKIGSNCTIHNNVTIGMSIGLKQTNDTPVIGDNVIIGENSLIYGNIIIGSNTTILRSAVLSRSVPEGALVGGNPAQILNSNHG